MVITSKWSTLVHSTRWIDTILAIENKFSFAVTQNCLMRLRPNCGDVACYAPETSVPEWGILLVRRGSGEMNLWQ